ncbi:MAG: hypothetical protein K5872_17170 [Rhizobiaceae bacterium]|nr:hypothetical protein [Rhizobiaceae bacterium]MCV0407955.1 hypothetical protein [Rhizobiaceae bacterium]
MRSVILTGIFVLSASTSWAQTTTSPQPADPAVEAQTDQATAARQTGPANLCQEILAFMKAPPPEAATPAGAAKPAEPPARQSEPDEQDDADEDSDAQQGTTASDEPAKAEGETGSAQEITGQDGVATDAPEPGKDNAASGSATNAPQKESRPAPLPPADVTSTPKESVLTVEAAEELASANNIAQCQKTARDMRVAGVAMPPPLMALAALDLQYQQTSDQAAEPSGTAEPVEEE